MANAISLIFTLLMPMQVAASSSSRNDTKARPRREPSMLRLSTTTSARMARKR